jgi:hypothetical protein
MARGRIPSKKSQGKGIVRFAAVDSSTIEIRHDDPLGAIVMNGNASCNQSDGRRLGSAFLEMVSPDKTDCWNNLDMLTDAVIRGFAGSRSWYR